MSFGKKLKELRLENNMSQAEFAKQLGIKQSAITAYEKDLNFPSSANLIKIADLFNVSVDYLLDRTSAKERNLGTSPDIHKFVPRPIINGKPVSDEELKEVTKIIETINKINEKRK